MIEIVEAINPYGQTDQVAQITSGSSGEILVISDCFVEDSTDYVFSIWIHHQTMETVFINSTPFAFSGWKRCTIYLENCLTYDEISISFAENTVVYVYKAMLVTGNELTDWSPAPEDVDEKFDGYSTIEQMTAAIELSKNSIISTVSGTYATLSELDSANGKITSLETWKSEASQKITKDGIIATVGNYYTTQSELTASENAVLTDAKEYTNTQVTAVETIATQTAEKFNWIVKSGSSATDFTLTDRVASLLSEEFHIDALTTFVNSAGDGTATVIDGGAIMANSIKSAKIDTTELFSQNITATNLHITGNSTFDGILNGATGSFSGEIISSSGHISIFDISPSGFTADFTNDGVLDYSFRKDYFVSRIYNSANALRAYVYMDTENSYNNVYGRTIVFGNEYVDFRSTGSINISYSNEAATENTNIRRFATFDVVNRALTIDGNISATTLQLSGSMKLANGTWNQVGDDAAFGDCNTAGCIGIKGITGNPGLFFLNKNENMALGLTMDETGALSVGGKVKIGTHLNLWTDGEGGNIELRSPTTNGDVYQIDAYNGNLRIYHNNNSVIADKNWVFATDGSLSLSGDLRAGGTVSGYRVFAGYDSGASNSMSCSNWFRSSGNSGWYNQTYGGGIYMIDSYYVRVSHDKGFLVNKNEIVSQDNPNAFRAAYGDYGWIMRNDGSSLWLLVTNAGDRFGTFNSLRPFGIRNSDGAVTLHNFIIPTASNDVNAACRPASDNTYTCGTAKNRFTKLYATNGTIQTSDEREKDILGTIGEDYKELFMSLEPIKYRWKYGDDKKIRLGLGAQTTERKMLELGILESDIIQHERFSTPSDTGMTDRYGIDYIAIAMMAVPILQETVLQVNEHDSKIFQLNNRIDQLQYDIDNLRTENEKLKSKLNQLQASA